MPVQALRYVPTYPFRITCEFTKARAELMMLQCPSQVRMLHDMKPWLGAFCRYSFQRMAEQDRIASHTIKRCVCVLQCPSLAPDRGRGYVAYVAPVPRGFGGGACVLPRKGGLTETSFFFIYIIGLGALSKCVPWFAILCRA